MSEAGEAIARDIAFVLRCSGAATVSYMLANAIGLPHPVWASMSGIIVSQEKLNDTRTATAGRVFGTVIGVLVAVTIGSLLIPFNIHIAVQMALAVAIAATIALRYPAVRVCMWTCPIVFLETDPTTPLLWTGLQRGAEVLLGGLVGAALHFATEFAIAALVKRESGGVAESRTAAKPHHGD